MPKILYLSESDLAALQIGIRDVIESIENMIVGRSSSQVFCAPKAVIQPPDGRYMMAAMAAADNPALLAVKTVVLNPRNPEQGLPQINGLITMMDSRTGLPVAVIDGNWVTAVRTAGLSAVAAKYMARPDAEHAAFIGCGVQARSHLRAFASMFPLKSIKVFGRGRANIDLLCQLAKELGLSPSVVDSGNEAMAGADLVVSSVTYTPDLVPFLDADRIEPGGFAAVTDLAAPWEQKSLSNLDKVIIDDLEQEAAMTHKLVDPGSVAGDLSDLVLGSLAGRDTDSERNAFVFRGHALGDLALSILAYEKACANSVGERIES